jgi:uncharacterized protein YidB (DUF937 family)
MGFFDFLKGSSKKAETAAKSAAAGGGAVAAGAAAAAEESAISKLFGEGGAKLSGLLDKLKVGGLDDKVKSWISRGENKPVTAAEVKAALGPEQVGAVAKDMGVSEDEAAGKIAKILPGLIDKLTPDGLVPDPDALAKKLTGLFK